MQNLKSFIEEKFKKDIRAHTVIDKKNGEFFDFPQSLNPDLKSRLINNNITKLYSHQIAAFDLISQNKNTLLVSSTASGKTLSFFLPILNEYLLSEKPFSVLLLYPTKALSRDQENTFGNLMNVIKKSNRLGTFDGDTPGEERIRIQKYCDFVITNPDMLHSGILPNHNRRWKVFLSRLRYIVVDEVHTYRGSFGSHVSNVFRRLLRVCEIHSSSPSFVCSSATIGNPKNHVEALFHKNFDTIQNDGSPKSGKEIYFINPPFIESLGYTQYRKGPAHISVPLIREAIKQKIRTICFCRARQEVERLYRAVIDGSPDLKPHIKPYRGGLLPNERRQLEKDILKGKLTVIISTNALELGIDIGDLDLCIISGHPGSIASFWQQAGRVGRKNNSSVVVFIAKDKPIDQYMVHHPDFILNASIEEAWLNADNPYILLQHIPCAAQEYPLKEIEQGFDETIFKQALEILKNQKIIVPYNDMYRYALQDYPSRGVNLRGMTDYNIEIFCDSEVIGELDPIGARGTLYKDAIYQHLGTRYISMELDLDKKLCRVEKVDVDYYTEAVWEGRVELIEKEEEKFLNECKLIIGEIYVNKQPKLYKKIKERTYENIGYGPITLPAFEYNTTGLSILFPKKWIDEIEKTDNRYLAAGLYGLSYLIKHTAPVLCMADINDIDTDVSLVEAENQTWKSTLYIFDSIEGGVGYSEKIYEKIDECLKLCLNIIDECECDSGCPSCIPPLPPGINDDDLGNFLVESNASTACTKSLLNAIIYNKIEMPEINITTKPIDLKPDEKKDDEAVKIQKKLEKAMKNLNKKREKLH